MSRTASVIVRTKDKIDSIERTLRAVRDQSVASELVVVDSGSTDGTLEVAQRYADTVVRIPPAEFSYGGALNAGAAAATGDVHFALSAHSVPWSTTWIEDSLRCYDREDVAATNHARRTPAGETLTGVYLQTAYDAVRHPWWGFSNHGSSWRASVWQDIPFREDLPATEDKEWSWRVLTAGWLIAYSPDLDVTNDHRRGDGLRAYWNRIRKESASMMALGGAEPPGLSRTLHAWWYPEHRPGYRSPAIRRFSPYRTVELAARYVAGRTFVPVPSSFHELRDMVEQQQVAQEDHPARLRPEDVRPEQPAQDGPSAGVATG